MGTGSPDPITGACREAHFVAADLNAIFGGVVQASITLCFTGATVYIDDLTDGLKITVKYRGETFEFTMADGVISADQLAEIESWIRKVALPPASTRQRVTRDDQPIDVAWDIAERAEAVSGLET
jgi:hypothetical protein